MRTVAAYRVDIVLGEQRAIPVVGTAREDSFSKSISGTDRSLAICGFASGAFGLPTWPFSGLFVGF